MNFYPNSIMQFFRKNGLILVLALSIILQLIGIMLQVVDGKTNKRLIAECDALREIRNQKDSTPDIFPKNGNDYDPQKMLKRAYELDQRAKQMQALKLTDETLKRYQSRYIKLYKDESQALLSWAKAIANAKPSNNKNKTLSLDALLQETDTLNVAIDNVSIIQDVTEQHMFLIDGLSGYCDK